MGNLVIDLLSRKVFLFNTDFASKTATVDTVTGNTGTTTYALTDVNNGSVLEFTSTGATTFVCPTGLTIGFRCTLVNLSTGTVTITAGAGTTVNNMLSTFLLDNQYQTGYLYYSSTNEWIFSYSQS